MTLGAAEAGWRRGGSEDTSWLRETGRTLSCAGAGPQGLPGGAMGTEMDFGGHVEVINTHSSGWVV